MKRFVWILIAGVLLAFSGCPDYSHLRPVPDYKNMTDGPVSETDETKSE